MIIPLNKNETPTCLPLFHTPKTAKLRDVSPPSSVDWSGESSGWFCGEMCAPKNISPPETARLFGGSWNWRIWLGRQFQHSTGLDPWDPCYIFTIWHKKSGTWIRVDKYIMVPWIRSGRGFFPNKTPSVKFRDFQSLNFESQELLAGMLSEGPQVGNGGSQVTIHWSLLSELPCKTSKKHASKIQMRKQGKARASQSRCFFCSMMFVVRSINTIIHSK